MTEGNSTVEGRAEFIEKTKGKDPSQFRNSLSHLVYNEVREGALRVECHSVGLKPEQIIQDYLDNFNAEMQVAETDKDKIRAIVRLAQDLDQAHVFKDGNLRTSAFILMNYLLIREGFSFVLWDNPLILDGYSLEQCCKIVQFSMHKVNYSKKFLHCVIV